MYWGVLILKLIVLALWIFCKRPHVNIFSGSRDMIENVHTVGGLNHLFWHPYPAILTSSAIMELYSMSAIDVVNMTSWRQLKQFDVKWLIATQFPCMTLYKRNHAEFNVFAHNFWTVEDIRMRSFAKRSQRRGASDEYQFVTQLPAGKSVSGNTQTRTHARTHTLAFYIYI